MVNFAELADSVESFDTQPKPKANKSGIDFASIADGLDAEESGNKQRAATVSGIVSEFNPDEIARARNLGRQVGIPDAVAERNPSAVRRKFISQKVEQLYDRAPVAGRRMADPDFAKLTHDITDELAGQEEALKQLALTKQGFRAASELSLAIDSQKRYESLSRVFGADNQRTVGDVFADPVKSFAGGVNTMLAGFVEANRYIPTYMAVNKLLDVISPELGRANREYFDNLQDAFNSGQEYWQGQKSGEIQDQIRQFNEAPLGESIRMLLTQPELLVDQLAQSLPYLIPGAGAARGGVSVMLAYTSLTEAMDSANSAREEAKAAGASQADQDIAAATAAIITAPLAFLGNKFIGTGKLETEFLTEGRLSAGLLSSMVREAISGGIEESSNQLGVNTGAYLTFDKDRQITQGVAKAGGIGALLEATQGAAMKGISYAAQTASGAEQDNARAQEVMAAFSNLQKLTEQATLKQRSAQDFQTFLQEAGDESGVSEVFVNANVLNQEAQNLGIDINVLKQSSPAIAEQIESALRMNDDLIIPVGEFGTAIAGTELGAALLKHIRADENGLSAFEAETQLNEAVQNLETSAVKFMEKEADNEVWQQELTAIGDEIKAQLSATGQTARYNNAVVDGLVVPFYDTLAKELKMTPAEVRDLFGFGVSGSITQPGLEQAGLTPTQEELARWKSALSQINNKQLVPKLRMPSALRAVGIDSDRIELPVGYLKAIVSKHQDVPLEVIENLPALLSDPLFVYPHKDGGINVVIDTKTADGNAIVVGIRDGRIRTITPRHGEGDVPFGLTQALSKSGVKVYARNKEALVKTRASVAALPGPIPLQRDSVNDVGAAPATIAMHRDSRNKATIITRESLVKKYGNEFYQSNQGELVAQHNLSAENLLHADRMGGIPVPSLAVTKKQAPITGFGEITLLASPEMIDPKGYAKTKVFGADIYSPRYPQISYKLESGALAELNRLLEPYQGEGRKIYGSEIDRVDDLIQMEAFKKYIDEKLGENSSWSQMKSAAADLLREAGAKERIFNGFTYSGNRKYIDHTLENVVRLLKQELRGGESFNYGLGSVRSKFTPQFKSIADIRKNKTRLMDKAGFEAAKEELEQELFALSDTLAPYHWNSKNFGFLDTVTSAMSDAARMGIPRALSENGFEDVPAEAMEPARQFLEKLRTMPTEYFEAKILRDVDIAEFSGAVVPEDVDPRVVEALKKRGVDDIRYYKNGDEESRSAAIAQFENLFFQKSGSDTKRGQISFGDDITQGANISLLKNADASTFIHELGHFFLEVYANIASDQNAPDKIVRDMDSLLEWFGIEATPETSRLDVWRQMTLEQKRPYHEKLARGFEQYALEGKAPTLATSRIFAQIRSFMLSAYESLKKFFERSGEPGLTKEVRQVFDRMLATEQAIEQAQSIRGMFPLYASAEEAGMTPEEYAEYVQGDEDATNEAKAQLNARSLRDLKWLRNARARFIRELQKDADAARREVRMEVRREVMSQPVYQAMAWLKQLPESKDTIAKKKKSANVDPEVDSLFAAIAKLGGLQRDVMVSEFGVDPKDRPDSGLFGKPVLRKEGGMHPELMAESLLQYGYLAADENGKADVREFEERFFEELRGNKQYSAEGEGAMMRDWQENAYTDEAVPDFDAIGRGKIDLAMMQAIYGQDGDWQKLGVGRTGMIMADGYDPGHIASFFGFSSGDQLVQSLMTAENPIELIEQMVDERMLAKYSELATDAAMQEAADKAVHNEIRARLIATELAAQNKSMGNRRLVEAAAREYANRLLGNTKVRDIKANKFTRAEAKAAKVAESALKKGETQTVVQAKKDQLLNNMAAKSALDAIDEVEKTLKYLKKFESEGTRKNLDIEYLEQIDDILSRFDLRKGQTLSAIDKRQSLVEWIADQEQQGLEPVIDEQLLNEARRESYKNLTLDEFRALADSIRNIEHLGRLKKKLLTAKDQREYQARIDEAKASIAENANRTVPEKATPNDMVGRFALRIRQMWAAHRKFSSFMRELDGGNDLGVMADLLLYPMYEAGSKETELRAKAAEDVSILFAPLEKTMDYSAGNLYAIAKTVPGTNISMTHEQRIMFGMNWGNEGNRKRLLDGGIAGSRSISMQDAQAILDTLTKAEWDFIQSMLDYIGSYRDQIAQQERELTGREPKWVEPTPIETKFGTYPGGYFPIKYDAILSTRSESLEAATDLRMAMKGAFNTAATRNGYAQQRAQAVMNRPVLLSFDVVSRHVHEVTHRLAWQSWLTDANRVLKSLDGEIRERLGPEALQEMRQHVRDIADGDAPITRTTDVILSRIRTGTSIIGMGYRVTTALLQPSGIFMTMARLGTSNTINGIRRVFSDPVKTHQWVMENSSMMRNRAKTLNREINEIMNTVRAGKKLTALQASYFFMITKMQMMIDIPTYVSAYEKALADLGYENAASEGERQAIEKKAHTFAGQTVIDTQVGGEIKDLAGVQKGGQGQKLFTNFYSWFSALYNLNAENFRTKNLKNPVEFADFVATAILLNVMPAIYSVLLKEALKGDCGWDDTECLLQRYKSEQMGTIFGQVIGMRDIGAGVDVATGGIAYGYSGPPSLRLFSDVYKASQHIEQGEADVALFKSLNNVGGILFHYPAGQINTTLDGMLAIEKGEVEGISAAAALIAGPPKN